MFNLTVRNKKTKFRKWKVKDRNAFLSSPEDPIVSRKSLLYDVIDPMITLSNAEYKYAIAVVRDQSVKDRVQYEFICPECDHEFNYEVDLSNVIVPRFLPYGAIQTDGHVFVMGDIRNQEMYDSSYDAATTSRDRYLVDFVFHVQSYNSNETMTYDEVVSSIDSMDSDAFESVLTQWNAMKFTCISEHPVVCPGCKKTTTYDFDDYPGFFPLSWGV